MNQFSALIHSARPKQIPKNFFLFAGFLFNNSITEGAVLLTVLGGFVIFSLTSAATYIMNDLIDRTYDQAHPEKRNRPIASGQISPGLALMAAMALILLSAVASSFISPVFLTIVGIFIVLNVLYSFWFKHVVIVDIFSVAGGFVIRVCAGVELISAAGHQRVETSSWFILTTFFLALFLVLGKRRHEIRLPWNKRFLHRPVLKEYPAIFLNQLIAITATITILSYTLWTIFGAQSFNAFFTTVPFVVYGIYRYLYIVYKKRKSDSPEDALFEDLPLQICIFLWFCLSLCLMNI